jgi:hypothetical protein
MSGFVKARRPVEDKEEATEVIAAWSTATTSRLLDLLDGLGTWRQKRRCWRYRGSSLAS